MYWTLELASYMEDAPWPATKEELIDYSIRSGAPDEIIENLQSLEDEGEVYENIEDLWPDYPRRRTFSSTRTNTKRSLLRRAVRYFHRFRRIGPSG